MASAPGTPTIRQGAIALLALCALIATLAPARATAATPPLNAVPGEILIRYAPGASPATREAARDRAGVIAKRNLLLADLQLARTLPGVPVSAALAGLSRDPRVRYAEPNWLYAPQRTPNDPRFSEQWNLRNTGQTVGGVQGVPGADISAPAAWDTAIGSRNVKVAVIDHGIQYYHPDLAANMWRNPGEAVAGEGRNGLDDDHNGFTDDLYGWDFTDNDADPLDESVHGTSVAGVIGAVGHNGLGITGVNWNVSLIALRVCGASIDGSCPISAIVDAIIYAGRTDADVANMSFGGASYSQAERDAIAAAPSTLFVPGSGNDGTDNDSAPFFPCSYDLPNLVCVTATDSRDDQAGNYGATSVDLGAPGINVLVPNLSQRTLFSDDFENAESRWDYTEAPAPADPSKWRRTASTDPSRKFGLQDSEGVQYPNNADTRVTLNAPVDLSTQQGCLVRLEAMLATEPSKDYLRVEAATSPAGPYSELVRVSGSTKARWVPVAASLEDFDGQQVYLRLRLTSDPTNTADGARVDNVEIRCEDPTASYYFNSGTSFAAPHVAGAAALVKSHMPGLSVAQLRERLLRTVDLLPSLAGRTVTGGRLNVARALTADLDAPTTAINAGPPALSDSPSASFGFSASEAGSSLECRLDGGAFAPCSSPKQYADLGDGQHTFGVRATDTAGNVGQPAQATWTIDTTAPVMTITDGPASSTTSRAASLAFVASEAVEAFECSLDGSASAGCASPASYDGLAVGSHTFSVRARDAAGHWSAAPASRSWTIADPPIGSTGGDGPIVEPGAVAPRAPVLGDPQPQAFDPPGLTLTIPRQTLGYALRRGLVSFAVTRAACPCRLSHTLRLDAGLARVVGLVGRRSATTGLTIGRATIAFRAPGRVRAGLQLSRPARVRLRGVPRLRGWLDAKLTDRYGRSATARQRVRLHR